MNTVSLFTILPIVLYHGKQYPYSCDIYDAFSEKEFAKEYLLKTQFLDLDLTQKPEQNLACQDNAGLMQFLFKIIFERDTVKKIENSDIINSGIIATLDKDQKLIILRYLLFKANSKNTKEMLKVLKPYFTDDEKDDAMTTAQRLRQEGRQEGSNESMEKIISNMILHQCDSDDIIKMTGASLDKVETIKNHMKNS
ncbi:MAG: hypothetical protein COC15_00715 [Legionellales bacterium]|nr:MAG: hypothetical protein COC15_00715 [Legionellales bacterium]